MKPELDIKALFPELQMIKDEALRAGVEAVWQELWQASAYDSIEKVPSSPEIPYPHVPHNRAVLALALAAADIFERFHGVAVNRDVLIAAGLLQDVSKLVEYQPEVDATGLTAIGKGYPHAFWAAHVALEHGLPDSVCQVILTHTPNSPKFPDSLEGKILYYVDQIDILAIYGDRWRKELFITK
jgi:hypothetical protein